MPTLYRLTDYPVHAMPAKFVEAAKATNEWRAMPSIGHGESLIVQADQAAKSEWAERAAKTKSLVQILTVTSPKNGRNTPLTSPKNGHGTSRPVQKMDMVAIREGAAKPMLVRVSP